jgi:hypothetical protein
MAWSKLASQINLESRGLGYSFGESRVLSLYQADARLTEVEHDEVLIAPSQPSHFRYMWLVARFMNYACLLE